jgi:phage terminase large subunit
MPQIEVDWKNPNYQAVFVERARRLAWLRANPDKLPAVKKHYASAPGGIAQFISDWAMTLDPRVSGRGRTPLMPFLLFPKQVELVDFVIERWRNGEPGVMVKSRDVGASWIAFATACALSIFNKDFMAGFGSAKEDKLDRSGDPDTLFAKGRAFMQYIPPEFRAGWTLKNNSQHLRLTFPDTGSSITGEAGDNMGRGGRKAIYFVDEAAFVERPLLIDGNLSANTDCRIDMSTVNGTANPFAQKAMSGKIKRFDFTWRDDPRKDEEWYAKKCAELDNPIIVAQELDCSFTASAEGVIIPSLWVQACLDAHVKLGIKPTGIKRGGLDVSDLGRDKNAFVVRHGILVPHASQWTGKESYMSETAEKAFTLSDDWGLSSFLYDGDGMGAGTRSDVKRISDNRALQKLRPVVATMYRGSGAVHDPEGYVKGTDRKNEDYYKNAKAQNWFHVRDRCKITYNAVVNGLPYDPNMILSISSTCPERQRLMAELSQPVYKSDNAGKMLVDKLPDGALSPNLADALVIAFSLGYEPMAISDAALNAWGPQIRE